ncbi:hypothetical protein [Peribacillus loiseleuriae]|uniref:hypothetical protein n=1 Tax=Peribacillus loiseleuriae TaxID=1679170 RepID=UPI003CFFD047
MTDKTEEKIDQILDKVKSLHSNLKDFRTEMREQFSQINNKLDTFIEKRKAENNEIHESLDRISKNLER